MIAVLGRQSYLIIIRAEKKRENKTPKGNTNNKKLILSTPTVRLPDLVHYKFAHLTSTLAHKIAYLKFWCEEKGKKQVYNKLI